MNRRERLMNAITGKPVDRPPVSFYEINGLDEKCEDPDPYNIYNDPSWKPLIELARDKSDRIVMRNVYGDGGAAPIDEFTVTDKSEADAHIVKTVTVSAGSRMLRSVEKRSRDVNTWWQVEHLLKGPEDIQAFLSIPPREKFGKAITSEFLDNEKQLGDTGIVLVDGGDPLCSACSLIDFGTYTVIALTEPELFHRLLEHFAVEYYARTEAIASELPGRLWRICGAEYASVPYLPPSLFKEYWLRYTKPMIDIIHKYNGIARVHCHGNISDILDYIIDSGCDGLDPIEPPSQGDIELAETRKRAGENIALFGNLEISDIENLETTEFAEKISRALDEGPNSDGSRFILMPSACPYGRKISALTMANYEKMIELAGC